MNILGIARQQLDQKLEAWQSLRNQERPSKGWLRAVRTSLGLSMVALAKRLEVTPGTIADIERSEARGTVTLNSLRKAAAAMDCDVVYAIVPRTSLEDVLNRRAMEKANAMLAQVAHSMLLEGQAIDPQRGRDQAQTLAQTLIDNPKVLWK